MSLLLAAVFASKPLAWLAGLPVGVLYSNAFECFFHRFLLHVSWDFFAKQHGIRHSIWGGPDEPLFVNFAKTAWAAVALFAVNMLPLVAAEWALRTGLASGMIAGFVIYFITMGEMHWRIHMGGWLPSWLQFGRRHHLRHHARSDQGFNVFFPFFDWLLRTAKG